jgi:hypothetical protein
MLADGTHAPARDFNLLGVDENARGIGIGAVVTHCTDLYFELGYRLAFGQIRLGSGLETYYPKLGFKVLAEGVGGYPDRRAPTAT